MPHPKRSARERQFFGTNGEPIALKYGRSKWLAKFDDRGDEIEKTWLDLADHPVVSKESGAAKVVSRFDPRGNLVEKSFFDADLKPIAPTGWSREVSTFDSATGKHIATARYDTHGDIVKLPQ